MRRFILAACFCATCAIAAEPADHQSWDGYDRMIIALIADEQKADSMGRSMSVELVDTIRRERLHYVVRAWRMYPHVGPYSYMSVRLLRMDGHTIAQNIYEYSAGKMFSRQIGEAVSLKPPTLEMLKELIQSQAGLSDEKREVLTQRATSFITTWEEAVRIANGMSSAPPAGDAPDCC